MIRNLLGSGQQTAESDVLVVGGGTCGLAIAVKLAKEGLRVVCIESGDARQDEDEHPLNDVVHLRSAYAGAAKGRFRCLGGTSTRWGGALIPFLQADLEHAGWPLTYDEIMRYLPEAENFFDLPAGSYELKHVLESATANHIARLAKWPPFAKRNVANLVDGDIKSGAGPQVWLNATATKFSVVEGRLAAITAQASDGSALHLTFKHVVIAAGAIESTRLLLLMDRQNDGAVTAGSGQLGRYFHDHLSTVVAHLENVNRKALNRLVGFRFEKGGAMRNLRFELTNGTPLRATVPPCFAHIAFENKPGSGFDSLRELFRHLQKRRLPPIRTFLRLAKSSPWLIRAVWWRFVEKRLLYPQDVPIEVHMVIEQQPCPDSYIGLSNSELDQYGLPKAVISWAPSAKDGANLNRAVDAFEVTWRNSPLAKLGQFVRRPQADAEMDMHAMGIYHPCGSTRMAETPDAGVVGRDLRLFHVKNVSVAATSVLPTAGGANPTMMLMMLAFRCADNVAKELLGARQTPHRSDSFGPHDRLARSDA